MKAALYLRQSVKEDEGIDRQRDRTTNLANAKGWSVVDEFEDNDTSATKPRGPLTGWGRMLTGLESGDFQIVIAVDLDRLLRTTKDLNTLIDAGAKVVTVDGEIDLTTADGEFRATMLAGIARFEGRRKGERMRRANEHRAHQGLPGGTNSWRAFGYTEDGLKLVDVEADTIRRGYADLLAGDGLAEIARSWVAAGTPSAQGGRWSASTVRNVLLNPRNTGWVRYRGELVRDADGSPVRAVWPGVVNEDTFRAAEALITDPRRKVKPRAGRQLLSGVALCGVPGCGATVHVTGANNRDGSRYRVYRCSANVSHPSRKSAPVDEWVSAAVVKRMSRADAADLLVGVGKPDAGALATEANVLRTKLEGLALDYADGILTRDQVATASARLNARLEAVQAQQADASRHNALGPLVGARSLEAAQKVWDDWSLDRRRTAIEMIMTVTLHPVGRGTRTFNPETVRIAWKTA